MRADEGMKAGRNSRQTDEEQDLLHLVRHLLGQQDDDPALADPALQYWVQPCQSPCGDMVFAARAPNGTLHVMLVDAGQQGLACYLMLLPVIAPFRRMTEKGFAVATIARELNLKVRETLPPNCSIALQLAAVDAREGIVSIWNGGMPPPVMLDERGSPCKQFSLGHAALGVLEDAAFSDLVEQHAVTRGEQLVMVSDGLLGASGPGGLPFGTHGLAATLASLSRSQRRAGVIAALAAHQAGQPATEDMTLVLVDCEKEVPSQAVPQGSESLIRRPGNWSFELQLDARELPHLDVVPMLLGVVSQFSLTQSRSAELFVILSELYNNALDHGVLRLDSRLKLSPDGMEAWLKLREERLADLQDGDIRLRVEQTIESGHAWLRIGCRDSGPGFDLQATLDCADEQLAGVAPSALPFGRGLALVKNIAAQVEMDGRNGEVSVLLPLDNVN